MSFGGLRIGACGLLLSALLHGQVVRLVDVIPNAQSGETGRDSEPSIAVNPANPLQMAISSFTNDPGGSANIPLFLSIDGGVHWTLSVPVVPGAASSSCVSNVCDITLRFATTSNLLYVAALEGDSTTGVTTYRITRVTNTFGAPTTDSLRTRTGTGNIPDQPYIEANTVLGGGGTGNDRLMVPFNDLTVFPGQTATVDRTLNAVPPAPAGFAGFVVESRPTPTQDSPPVRSAVHPSGVVYAAFTGRRAGGNEVVVVRDDNWGTGPGAFHAINDSDLLPGVRVVTGLTQSLAMMGTQRTGSPLSIAVHPDDSQTVYVVWCEGSTTANFTLHVRRSTNGGTAWGADLFTVTSAINPSIAVTARGEVGLLYQRLISGGTPTFQTHFILSNDGSFVAPTDIQLANVPTSAGTYLGANPIGDYTGLMAVGKTFYGVFSANNTPATANFHPSISYLRNANFGTQTLTNLAAGAVGVSVDPFFFSVTRTEARDDFYTRDWSNTPASHDEGQEPSTDPVFYENSDVWNRRTNTSGTFDAGTDRPDHKDPMEAAAGHNFAFVRVHRKAAAPGGSPDVAVTARFLIADYGLGTNYQDAGAAAMPVLTFAAADTVHSLADGQGYQWDLPVVHSTHPCMAVQLESTNDPPASTLVGHSPGWPTTDLMVLNDNNKAQRNMGVYTGPVGGTDAITFYAQIHNAATFRRDMVLRYEIDPRIARQLRVSKIELTGTGETRPPAVPQNGSSLTLSNMQPGETRWIGITMTSPAGRTGQFLPLHLTEVSNGLALNGVAMGIRPAEIDTVIEENLLLHSTVLHRLAALFRVAEAGKSADEALELSRKQTKVPDYLAFLKRTRPLVSSSAEAALKQIQPAGDPFAVTAAVTRLNQAVDLGKANPAAAAHAGLLFKLDALISRIDKDRGDTADILQNVYWQREVYGKSVKLRAFAAEVTQASTEFIRAFETHRADTSSFVKLIDRLSGTYQKTASALGNATLTQLAAALGQPGGSQELQKRHRDFLLRLQDLAP